MPEVNSRKLIITGYGRSGTKSLAQFFKLYDIFSVHQYAPHPGDRVGAFHINSPPYFVEQFINSKLGAMAKLADEWCESTWGLCYFLYHIQQRKESIDFLIVTRDALLACNSMLRYQKAHQSDKQPPGELTLDLTAEKYDEVYTSLIHQSLHMVPKPRHIKFERYVAGEYNHKLMGLFNIPPTAENLDKAEEHLKIKYNSLGGPYQLYDVDKRYNVFPAFDRCRVLRSILEDVCEEL